MMIDVIWGSSDDIYVFDGVRLAIAVLERCCSKTPNRSQLFNGIWYYDEMSPHASTDWTEKFRQLIPLTMTISKQHMMLSQAIWRAWSVLQVVLHGGIVPPACLAQFFVPSMK